MSDCWKEVFLEVSGIPLLGKTQLGFGEFIQKFRQEHNLAQEGIESEELLKEVRDLSSGREVIW